MKVSSYQTDHKPVIATTPMAAPSTCILPSISDTKAYMATIPIEAGSVKSDRIMKDWAAFSQSVNQSFNVIIFT